MSCPTYRITTLGCRTNHAEAREIEQVLRDRGLVRTAADDPADLEIIHSCSVTNAAAAKSRHAVRRAVRRVVGRVVPADLARHPDSTRGGTPRVIVTGCYAGTNASEAARLLGDAARVVPQAAADGSTLIERLARRVDEWLGRHPAHLSIRNAVAASSTVDQGPVTGPPARGVLPLPVVLPTEPARSRVRAELRIQDGCDAHCTFCIIPRIRPHLRSKTIPAAVTEARRLVDLGHREIVLTGVFIGAYGHETALRRRQREVGAGPLADLVHAIASVAGLQRLRISSMEPGDVTGPLLDAIVAHGDVVVPHLHLPLQSGSDPILRMMNRQYDVGAYLEMVARVHETLTTPDGLPPALTTDVICGFPGETEADFERTVAVVTRVGYLHLHVFPYSPRRGTAAARWRDRAVPEGRRRQRVQTLIALETDPRDGLSIRYRRRLLGRTVRVIVEGPDPGDPGLMTGRCDHYALVHLRTTLPRGRLVEARITEVTPERTVAEVVGTTVRLPVLG